MITTRRRPAGPAEPPGAAEPAGPAEPPGRAGSAVLATSSVIALPPVAPGPGGSARRVVPGVAALQQPVGLLRSPGALGVRMHRRDVAEHRVHDLPGRLDRALIGEQPAVPV